MKDIKKIEYQKSNNIREILLYYLFNEKEEKKKENDNNILINSKSNKEIEDKFLEYYKNCRIESTVYYSSLINAFEEEKVSSIKNERKKNLPKRFTEIGIKTQNLVTKGIKANLNLKEKKTQKVLISQRKNFSSTFFGKLIFRNQSLNPKNFKKLLHISGSPYNNTDNKSALILKNNPNSVNEVYLEPSEFCYECSENNLIEVESFDFSLKQNDRDYNDFTVFPKSDELLKKIQNFKKMILKTDEEKKTEEELLDENLRDYCFTLIKREREQKKISDTNITNKMISSLDRNFPVEEFKDLNNLNRDQHDKKEEKKKQEAKKEKSEEKKKKQEEKKRKSKVKKEKIEKKENISSTENLYSKILNTEEEKNNFFVSKTKTVISSNNKDKIIYKDKKNKKNENHLKQLRTNENNTKKQFQNIRKSQKHKTKNSEKKNNHKQESTLMRHSSVGEESSAFSKKKKKFELSIEKEKKYSIKKSNLKQNDSNLLCDSVLKEKRNKKDNCQTTNQKKRKGKKCLKENKNKEYNKKNNKYKSIEISSSESSESRNIKRNFEKENLFESESSISSHSINEEEKMSEKLKGKKQKNNANIRGKKSFINETTSNNNNNNIIIINNCCSKDSEKLLKKSSSFLFKEALKEFKNSKKMIYTERKYKNNLTIINDSSKNKFSKKKSGLKQLIKDGNRSLSKKIYKVKDIDENKKNKKIRNKIHDSPSNSSSSSSENSNHKNKNNK